MSQAAAPAGPEPVASSWTTAVVREVERFGDTFVKIRLDVADRTPHVPGQHYVVRLRAPDDYTAQRSYSIASDPDDPLVELMVECLPRGEVSSFLHEVVEVGDELEVRGPIGRWFVWGGTTPSICVAGGSGVVPFVSMMRYARRTGTESLLRVVASAQHRDKLPYADELEAYGAFIALTRENHVQAGDAERVAAHIYPDEIESLAEGVERAYVCGSVGFVSFVGRILGEAGVRSDSVRVEQFGPTG
ncbi:FAD-binding oxidoreductase [Aeromicrobium stalagmiti]|uniref:FAD-binding oxidoreductase n=1 Tax=Aeromicrobium stalagmiti TaxID=2738988 RepID=UPI00156A6896|nr:FAD-binding oxidoreductase [Aeromicrobium stalagmiti]NRQ49931.1 oxidoreductase [Aeromicrobium stalagmiti]